MMEAVGFIASIGTLVQGVAYIRKTLKDYKNGGTNRKRLLVELDHLQPILDRLQTDYDRAKRIGNQKRWLDNLSHLSNSGGILERINDIISEIRSKTGPRQGLRGKIIQWTWPFVQEDIDRNVRQIQHLSHHVSLALQNASLSLTFAVHERVARIDAATNKCELKAILGWLSPLNFLEQQQLEFLKAVPGTCEWFLSCQEYVAWAGQEHQVLYCSAIGGAGKTILASVVVDDLRMRTAGQDAGIFSIYCKHDRPDTHSPDKLSMTILRQLIQIKLGSIPQDIDEMLTNHYYTKDTRPTLGESLKIVNAHLPTFSATFIVVDGLDEITDETLRGQVVGFLTGLQGRPSVLFTSRPLDAIERVFVDSSQQNAAGSLLVEDRDSDSINSSIEKFKSSSKSAAQDIVTELGAHFDEQSTLCTADRQLSCYRCGTTISGLHYSCAKCTSDHTTMCAGCFHLGNRCANWGMKHDVFVEIQVLSLKMDVSARPGAIRTYVRRRIQQSPVLHKFTVLKPHFCSEIEDTVTEAAQRMFLLARLHMDTVSNPELLKFSEVRSALGKLPTELYDSYDQTLARVQRHGKSLLQLISWSCRPLAIREVEHALAILPGSDEIVEDEMIPAGTLISKCAGLVSLNENNEIVFSHYTIASYFANRRRDLFDNGHEYMAKICISYLNLKEFESGAVEGKEEGVYFDKRSEEFPLFSYASVFWARHAKESNNDEILQLSYDLIKTSACRHAMIQSLWFSADETTADWNNRNLASPLHVSMFFEYNQLTERLMKDGEDINAQDESGMTPLVWAARTGNIDMVRILLQAQAAVNVQNNDGENALYVAISRKKTDVALLLIDYVGVEINTIINKVGQDRSRTPLMQAIIKEETEVVEKLATRENLLIGLKDTSGSSAIDYAARATDPRIMKSLVKHPAAQIERQNGRARPPLIVAAYWGRLQVIKVLLDAGADVNATEAQFFQGTALMRAVDHDHEDVVRELLAQGANWSATDVLNRNAVHSAAINGSHRSLAILLDSTEIDFNLQDVDGNTPLHDAAKESIGTQALKLLLARGARADIVDKDGRTALDIARTRGVSRNVSTILSYGSENRGTAGKFGQNTLIEYLDLDLFGAARTCNMEAIDRHLTLIKKNSLLDVNKREHRSKCTALHFAAAAGHVTVIKKLLSAGADINILDKYGCTALNLAARSKQFDAVHFLLESGADVTLEEDLDSSAMALNFTTIPIRMLLFEYGARIPQDHNIQHYLHVAATLGKLKIVQRLVETGVSVQSKDEYGRSPYENAKRAGNQEVARYLDSIRALAAVSDSRLSSPSPRAPVVNSTSDENTMQPVLATVYNQARFADEHPRDASTKPTVEFHRAVTDHQKQQTQILSSTQHMRQGFRVNAVSSDEGITVRKTEHYIIGALLLLVLWLALG